MASLKNIKLLLKNCSSAEKAKTAQSFFKTGKGHYSEGDIFIGVTTPEIRKIIKEFIDVSLDELQELLSSKIHEERACALFILVEKYKKSVHIDKNAIVEFYLKNTTHINNWDLVDISCYQILGSHFHGQDQSLFFKLAESSNMWERRIAIVSCLYSIRTHNYNDTAISITKKLLGDKHDLIHKATGWVLREVGKKDLGTLLAFLDLYAKTMPRTMLRYSIEKLPEEQRLFYLRLK